jgi:hypothetical protein
VVSSQSLHAETRKQEDLITESLPSNDRFRGPSLTAPFRFQASRRMSHKFIVTAVSSGSTIPAFRSERRYRHTDIRAYGHTNTQTAR